MVAKTTGELIEYLFTLPLNTPIAYSIWKMGDVQAIASQYHGGELSTKNANMVLENLQHNHDASIGINWDMIDFQVENLLEENNHD